MTSIIFQIEYKREAVQYQRSGKLKPRTIESVKSRFRKVSSVRQLRRWEKQLNEGGNRLEKLRQISAYTLDKFSEVIERKAIIHNQYYTMAFASVTTRKLTRI